MLERSEEVWDDGLPSFEISLESVESHADTTQQTAEPY
jgi:hypothetical protein